MTSKREPDAEVMNQVFEGRDAGTHAASLQSIQDRRSATREAVDWVRKALREHKTALDEVRSDISETKRDVQDTKREVHEVSVSMHELKENVLNSIPNRDPIGHLNDHIDIAQERQQRKVLEEENRKYWTDVYRSVLKALVVAVAGGLVVIVGLGLKAQLQIWTGNVKDGSVTIKVPEK